MSNPETIDAGYYELLEQLQAVDFVLVELTLYLDTHPQDSQAIQQYNLHAQQRGQLAQQFEEKYGPLKPFGHSHSNYPWQWAASPWPWQV